MARGLGPEEDEPAKLDARNRRAAEFCQHPVARVAERLLNEFERPPRSQPPIPGTVLLFTSERLTFRPSGDGGVGTINEPGAKFLIIDGQHRLPAVHFYLPDRPDHANTTNMPGTIFSGRSHGIATQIFVLT